VSDSSATLNPESGTANFPLPRIARPTRFEFEVYQEQKQPVVITDVAPHWGAMKKWNADYLKSVAGESMVTVHYDPDGDFRRWYIRDPSTRDDRQMRFGELLDLVYKNKKKARQYYMTEHCLREVSPKLLEDVNMADLVDLSGTDWEPLLFVGRDTCMPAHYHGTTEAVLCQFVGRKQVTLVAPDQTPYLYPSPWYAQAPLFSRINGREIQTGTVNLEEWPLFQHAKLIQFTLNPGEILYIPVHWWHVTSVPEDVSVSMTCFWDSRLRRWTFPSPGFEVCLREILHVVRKNGWVDGMPADSVYRV
jgi:hypothetical protein